MSKNYLFNEGENPKTYAERLQKQLDEYKEKINGIKDPKELEGEEKECINELDKYDEYLKSTEYVLPDDVTFDGTRYTKKDISSAILYFINKMEIKWDFTLGLYELSKLWRGDVSKLNFRELDSTLRTLDQVQFKGFKEWKDILSVNEYFKSVNEQFTIDTAGMIYLHQRHNAVIERQELVKTIPSVPEQKVDEESKRQKKSTKKEKELVE